VGLDHTTIGDGLKSFLGVKRRLEIVGEAGGVTVYDDFAHHPTAVAETLRAVREAYPGRRVWAVFEPRSASSCRRVFQKDFAAAFSTPGADETIVAAVFRSTLPPDERLSVEDLVADVNAAGRRARHVEGVDAIVDTIVRERRPGDVVVIMSNGAFDGIHQKLVSRLRQAAATA
jgi:UDP-N-acetylmuramate: L-alanyl-gamma-D-glutamyl-meso-diaminopimelate ligase